MDSQIMTNQSSSEKEIVYGIVCLVLGVVALFGARYTPWNDFITLVGGTLISIGTPLILWRLFIRMTKLNIIGLIVLMRKENLQAIVKDKEKGKILITKSFREWAKNQEKSTLKIKGVTLNLAFSNQGILNDLIEQKLIINPGVKKIQALLLNPYSMNAITRSIQESRPFVRNKDQQKTICEHTLDQHKSNVLYKDFTRTGDNIKDLIRYSDKHGITIECKIYSALSPSFLLINDHRAIMENLILSKISGQEKLYGTLPHLVYGNGKIKNSLENHFDYIWLYDSIPLEDFHEEVEEKYFEINRLFLLYRLQTQIWEEQWWKKGRSFSSEFDILYEHYKELYPNFSPKRILDLGCGDGGGGSLKILGDYPNAEFDYVDISGIAISYLKENIAELEKTTHVKYHFSSNDCDMLTFLNRSEPFQYSLVYANFSIIYMTKIKAIEVYRKIFNTLQSGGIFMLSLWTTDYFSMPIGQHGEEGKRPGHEFVRVPMTEDLRVLTGGSGLRIGEIRRFYRGLEELLEEFETADEHKFMDLENIVYCFYENQAVLRVWV